MRNENPKPEYYYNSMGELVPLNKELFKTVIEITDDYQKIKQNKTENNN
ncbi:MAG: hypothetical protein AABW67_01970 [Nanoarchaeota archaeon]